MSDLSDSDLIKLVRSGSVDYFAELVNRHQRLVVSIIRQVTSDYDRIEDLAQEVFIRAYKGLKKFRGESKFSTWLGQIAYRTAVDSLKRRRELQVEEADLDRLDLRAAIPDNLEAPDAAIEAEGERQWLRDLVQQLPARYRLAVSLHYFEDKPIEEVAAISGMPAGTVKSHLHRARFELRRLIERERKKGYIKDHV